MKLRILFYNLICVSFFSKAQFYEVPEQVIQFEFDRKIVNFKVNSFSISEHVTVSQFKDYLDAIRKDSSEAFYLAQLPSSGQFKSDLLEAILKKPDLQNKAMPGVSWTVARNYCKWFASLNNTESENYYYDLPMVEELIAFQKSNGIKTDQLLECWTIESYDESMMYYTNKLNFQYLAKKEDPPALKRKMIYGGSYFRKNGARNDVFKFSFEYQDSSSRYVGFRIVKKERNKILPASIFEETKKPIDKIKKKAEIKVSLKKNKLHGLYEEFYENGKPKVKGRFYYGQRKGVWKVWNENGDLIIERKYQDNRTFEFIYPVSNHPYKEIYDKFPVYVLKRNSDNYYPWNYVEERSVVYSKRIWRELTKNNEFMLFEKIDFKKVVEDLIKDNINWFLYTDKGNFKYLAKGDTMQNIIKTYQTWDYDRIEIKEDFIFSADMLRGETRLIGLGFYKNKQDSIPTYQIYFPNARKTFAKFDMTSRENKNVTNLDDYFYFNAYRGNISFVVKNLKNEKDVINDWDEEMSKLIIEHENWINYGR